MKIEVNQFNALNVSIDLASLTTSTRLTPKDLENTVVIVENLQNTLPTLSSEEITQVSIQHFARNISCGI